MTRGRPDGDGVERSRPRILVVDDDDDVCEVLREALTDEGYAVATVPHGAAALELVKHHRPAVITCDLRMPIMDGWSFVDRYRKQAKPPASVILLSALKDVEENAKRLGADGYVKKPFDLSDVVTKIERCLAQT
ncbi:MAG: response regulator [Chloroflexota bacterium]|nr:response regulator [Chloroflexota bacterium]